MKTRNKILEALSYEIVHSRGCIFSVTALKQRQNKLKQDGLKIEFLARLHDVSIESDECSDQNYVIYIKQ